MRPIPLGARGTFVLHVRPAHLANQFKDALLPEVFATPMMVTAMENAALNAIRGYLDPGESAVGTALNIRHIAATPVGHDVTAEAEVSPSTAGTSRSRSRRATRRRKSAVARMSAPSSTSNASRRGSPASASSQPRAGRYACSNPSMRLNISTRFCFRLPGLYSLSQPSSSARNRLCWSRFFSSSGLSLSVCSCTERK